MSKRARKSIEAKNKISTIALKLFKNKGYNNVTVDDIVAEAGISKGSFYNYFKSKDQVIIDKFKEIDSYYIKIYLKLRHMKSSKDKILLFIKYQQEFIENMGVETLQVVYISQINKESESIFLNKKRSLYIALNKLVKEGQNKGEIREDITALEITEVITRCMRGLYFDWCALNGNFDLLQDGQIFFNKIFEGFLNY